MATYKYKLTEGLKTKLKKDTIPGGLSDNKTLEDIANHHSKGGGELKYKGVLRLLKMNLRKGIEVEKEHTNDPKVAREIAMDHLWEDPQYYNKLSKLKLEENKNLWDEILSKPILAIVTKGDNTTIIFKDKTKKTIYTSVWEDFVKNSGKVKKIPFKSKENVVSQDIIDDLNKVITDKTRMNEQEDSDEKIGSKEDLKYNIVITPLAVDIDEVVKALETVKNYGPYISNLRNTKADIEKAVEDHFGPNQRFKKIKLEKERGKPFPPKTKQAIDTFIKTISIKPNILKWEVEGENIVFPYKKNPNKQTTKNIINTVMKNAGIDVDVEEKEATITELEHPFNIDVNLAFKIYDILSKNHPSIRNEYSRLTFYHFLNNELDGKNINEIRVNKPIGIGNHLAKLKQLRTQINSSATPDAEKRALALQCAELVLPIFEREQPNDKRVRQCIQVTKKYLNGEATLEELSEARYGAGDAIGASTSDAAYYAASAAFYAAAYAYAAADYAIKATKFFFKLK